MRAIVEMEGGIIHSITSDEELDILLIDHDTDGTDPDEYLVLPDGSSAYFQMMSADTDEFAVENLFSLANVHPGTREESEEDN